MTVTRKQLLDAITADRDALWELATSAYKSEVDAAAGRALMQRSADAYTHLINLVFEAMRQ